MEPYDCTLADADAIAEQRSLQHQLGIYIEQLLKATEAGKGPDVLGQLYNSIAAIHDTLERFSEAEVYFRAAAHSFGFADQPKLEAQAWLQVGELRVYLIWLDAQDAFEQARRAAKRAQDLQLQAQALHGLGRVKQSRADFEGALADYELALVLAGADESLAAATLRSDILEGITALQLEPLLQRAIALAEKTNRDAETPETAPRTPRLPGDPDPGDPDPIELDPMPLPVPDPFQLPDGTIRNSGGPRPIWPRWPRRRRRRR